MTCGVCGADVREGAKFCSECGTPTLTSCPNCGHAVSPTAKFCDECGHQLAAAPTTQSAPAATHAPATHDDPPEERRFVSTLFLDLVGFTPLTQTRDSEEVRGMLTTYFERAREVVDRFGGVIDKYIGDALMAVWGAHTAHEDDAERMVRAGLELIAAIEALGDELGIEGLTARVGGTSGEAAVGGDGNQGTGLIIGDIVNLASRLEGAAPHGRMLVDEATKNLVGGIEFEPGRPYELKGMADPVEAFVAGRVVAGNQGRGGDDGIVPPFIGRADEVRLLKDAFHATGRERRSRLVSIIGQAGIGKSRLIGELWNYLDGLPETTYWHQGRSPSYGAGLSYWSLAEMVRQRCGIAETDDEHRSRTRLRTTLAEYIDDGDDRAWMEPRLEALLGLGETPSGERAELFAAWRMLFLEIARLGNVVMVFEDLHWADDGVLDFIEELVSVANELPILVVAVSRPELLDRRSGWGTGMSTLTAHLPAMAPETMRELITGVVPEVPEAAVASMVEHSGGVPLYAVEMLRMLANRGLIRLRPDGRYEPDGDLGTVEIPDSLQSLVGARLDQLEPDERALVNDAALLGQSFTLEGMAVLQETDDLTGLADRMEPLVKREVLSLNRDPRSPERGQYRFVQSIIREIAHQRISKAERLARHLKVASYFESLGDPEVSGVVAIHLLSAFEVASETDRDELRERVVAALVAAADRAADLQAHAQALILCERGLEIVGDARSRGTLLIRAMRSSHAGLDDREDEFGEHAIEAMREAGDAVGLLEAATEYATALNNRFRANEAITVLDGLVDPDAAPTPLAARAMGQMARAHMMDRHAEDSVIWADRALAIAEAIDELDVFADTLITKATAYGNVNRLREAMLILEAAEQFTGDHEMTHARRRALNNLAYLSSSDTLTDLRAQEERLKDARRLGEPRYLADALIDHAGTMVWQYRFAEAEALLAEIDLDQMADDVRFAYEEVLWMQRRMVDDPVGAESWYRAEWAKIENPDGQTAVNIARERAGCAFFNQRYEDTIEAARQFPSPSPLRLDVFYGGFAGMLLRDRDAIVEALERSHEGGFRGRHITLMQRSFEGAIAALDGNDGVAEAAFREAIELAEEVWATATYVIALATAAMYLGTDHPLGSEWGRRAHDIVSTAGATNVMTMLSAGMVPPTESVSQAG